MRKCLRPFEPKTPANEARAGSTLTAICLYPLISCNTFVACFNDKMSSDSFFLLACLTLTTRGVLPGTDSNILCFQKTRHFWTILSVLQLGVAHRLELCESGSLSKSKLISKKNEKSPRFVLRGPLGHWHFLSGEPVRPPAKHSGNLAFCAALTTEHLPTGENLRQLQLFSRWALPLLYDVRILKCG